MMEVQKASLPEWRLCPIVEQSHATPHAEIVALLLSGHW